MYDSENSKSIIMNRIGLSLMGPNPSTNRLIINYYRILLILTHDFRCISNLCLLDVTELHQLNIVCWPIYNAIVRLTIYKISKYSNPCWFCGHLKRPWRPQSSLQGLTDTAHLWKFCKNRLNKANWRAEWKLWDNLRWGLNWRVWKCEKGFAPDWPCSEEH